MTAAPFLSPKSSVALGNSPKTFPFGLLAAFVCLEEPHEGEGQEKTLSHGVGGCLFHGEGKHWPPASALYGLENLSIGVLTISTSYDHNNIHHRYQGWDKMRKPSRFP